MKEYLSKKISRALSFDHPVGDPLGGPAYGERNDPGTLTVVASVLGAANAAKSLMAKTPSAPAVEAPRVMPTSDAAAQAALAAKKRAGAAQTSGRASTLLSQGTTSTTLGG